MHPRARHPLVDLQPGTSEIPHEAQALAAGRRRERSWGVARQRRVGAHQLGRSDRDVGGRAQAHCRDLWHRCHGLRKRPAHPQPLLHRVGEPAFSERRRHRHLAHVGTELHGRLADGHLQDARQFERGPKPFDDRGEFQPHRALGLQLCLVQVWRDPGHAAPSQGTRSKDHRRGPLVEPRQCRLRGRVGSCAPGNRYHAPARHCP